MSLTTSATETAVRDIYQGEQGIHVLPNEVFMHSLFPFLSRKDLAKVSQVCARAFIMVQSDPASVLKMAQEKAAQRRWVQDPQDPWTSHLMGGTGRIITSQRIRVHV